MASQTWYRQDRRGVGALILVVLIGLVIILLLYFAGNKSYMGQVAQTRKRGQQVAEDIQTDQLTKLIFIYRQNNDGKLPKGVQDMGDDAQYFRDPWGGAITFTIEENERGGGAKIKYHSPGRDGQDGTPDDINKTEPLPGG